MKRKLLILFFLILINFAKPFKVFSAEVLQVTSSSSLQIGDNNRNYTVKVACINIYPYKDKEANQWLSSQLPRKSKVNLHPKGSLDGALIAELISVKNNTDIAKSMAKLDFGDYNC